MLRQGYLKAILLILVVGIITYANTFANRFVWDDRALIIENELIRDSRYIPQIFTTELYRTSAPGSFYRPIQTLSYLLDYSIWNLNPYGYHFTNLLIHIVNGVLVYILVLISARNWRPKGLRYNTKEPQTIALFSALLFTVHPIQVQAVTYISGRSDLLACSFMLLSLILFMNRETISIPLRGGFPLGIVSLLSFIFALLSKEIALIFPFVLLVGICLKPKRDVEDTGENSLKYSHVAPFFWLAFIYIVLRMTVLRFSDKLLPQELSLGFGMRFLTSFKILVSYLGLLLSPFGLHPEYVVEPVRSVFAPDFLISLVVIIILVILLIWAYRVMRVLFFWGGYFLITLFPVMNIIPINAQMSEHFLYIPSMGFFAIFAWILYTIGRIGKLSRYRWLPGIILTLVILSCIIITIDRNTEWRDELTLFKKTVEYSPTSYRAHFNLGAAYYNEGLYGEAIIEFKKVLELNPDLADARRNIEEAQKRLEK